MKQLTFSGRTDAGVHACSQVVSFASKYVINSKALINHVNKHSMYLKINDFSCADDDFNARKSASFREYIYIFSDKPVPVYLSNYVTVINQTVDISIVQECLNFLIGTHDFNGFRKTGSNENSTIRKIVSAKVEKFCYKVLTDSNKSIILNKVTIKGNAFLYRMIRNIMGSIFLILDKNNILTPIDFNQTIEQKRRVFDYKPADPQGLYLNKIFY